MEIIKPFKSLETYLDSLIQGRLWVKVIIAMFLGIAGGVLLSPATGFISSDTSVLIGGWLALPGKLFLKLVQMIMIPLIFSSIIIGLVSVNGEKLKQMGVSIGAYFVFTTFVSIAVGVVLTLLIRPGDFFESDQKAAALSSPNQEITFKSIPEAISDLLPENPLASMMTGEMLAVVIFTIIVGVAIVQINTSLREPIIKLLVAIQEICMTIVKWAMKLVPIAVFGLMAQITSSIGINSLKGIVLYIFTVLIGLVILLIFYLAIIGLFTKTNVFSFLKKIRGVQLLAFSTTSSAAVMPLTIKTAQEELGVSKSVSNFLIPIGATVNMDGTAIYQCISALFSAQAYGLELSISAIVLMMFTIVAASLGTPAIPGGGIVILASVLQNVGIPSEGIVMIIGVERILGMFRVAINVTGDLTACLVFNKMEKKWAG